MLRSVLGVIVGYLVFGVPAFLLFRLTGHEPHAPASLAFQLVAVVWGILFALLAGYVASLIAGRTDLRVPFMVTLIVVLLAAASMISQGVSWSPLTAIIFMAPAVVAGGRLRLRGAVRKNG